MKKLLLAIAVFAAFVPTLLLTTPVQAQMSALQVCAGDTFNCACTSGSVATNFPNAQDGDACSDACAEWESQLTIEHGQTTEYRYTCKNVIGVEVPIESGTVEDKLQRITENPEAVRKPIFPCLNVDIPGIDIGENCEWQNAVMTRNAETGVIESNILGEYVKAVYQYLLGAATVVALTFLMIGGVQYAISRGDAGMLAKGKERIKNAITGLILLLLAYNIAFLIDPGTVMFRPLTVQYIARVENFPPDGEDLNITPNSSLSGIGEPLENEPYITNLAGKEAFLDSQTLDALRKAAKEYYDATGGQQTMVLTSASRNLTKQAVLFYNNCLATSSKRCVVPTCNPAAGSSVISSTQPYVLRGELAGVEDPGVIVNSLVKNGKYGNCPHTSLVAVDVWGDASKGEGWVHDPVLQQMVITSMVNNGFCRLQSEPWHFELNSKRVSGACSPANSTLQYKSITPSSSCAAWDFKNHECIATR